MVFCHRVESCHCTQDDKSEHPSLKETSVQRPSQRSPAQTTAQAHTAHTKLQGLSALVLLRFFLWQRVQELQALTLTQACHSKITKYSDLIGFSKAGKLIAWIWLWHGSKQCPKVEGVVPPLHWQCCHLDALAFCTKDSVWRSLQIRACCRCSCQSKKP